LPATAKSHKVKPPALIVIGSVVRLMKDYDGK
jgi:siroheme synthase